MAQRNVKLSLAAPALDLSFSQDLSLGDNSTAETLEVIFPKGCNGLVEVGVLYANVQVIPEAQTQTLTGNGQSYHFALDDYPENGQWSAYAINNDIYPHTIRFVFGVNAKIPVDDTALPPVIMLPFSG